MEDAAETLGTLDDVAGLLNGVSNALRKIAASDGDAALALFSDALGAAYCHVCEVSGWLEREHGCGEDSA